MRIALDIDSTLHHYWDLFADVAERRFGVTLPYERQEDWHVTQLAPEQIKAVVTETHARANVLAAEPYPGAVETVRAWHEAGHWIHVTSHRAEACRGDTAAWLDRIGLPHDDLHCSWDKIARCVELGIDVLVDDSPVNIERALDAGMVAATILHPWNREVCRRPEVVAAEDWPGLARALVPVLGDGRRRERHGACP